MLLSPIQKRFKRVARCGPHRIPRREKAPASSNHPTPKISPPTKNQICPPKAPPLTPSVSHLKSQVSGLSPPPLTPSVSLLRSQVSGLRSPSSALKSPSSGFKSQVSGFRFQVSIQSFRVNPCFPWLQNSRISAMIVLTKPRAD